MPAPAALLAQLEASGKLSPATLANLRLWLGSGSLPAWATQALGELSAAGEWSELEDRFYKGIAFGTGGMRGRTQGKVIPPAELGTPGPLGTPEHAAVGSACLNEPNILRATKGLFLHLVQAGRAAPRLVVAHDVRHFSRAFAERVASAWIQLGGEAFLFDGPRSTPQLSFTVRHLHADAGVVLTASHNPPHDNGFKCCLATGGQVMPPDDTAIIRRVESLGLADVAELADSPLVAAQPVPAAAETAYLDQLVSGILDPETLSRHAPRVVFTNLHGTGDVMVIPALRRVGVEPIVVEEQREHDPRFPTVRSPNPENPDAFALALRLATEQSADLILATDPDADRLGAALPLPGGGHRLLNGNEIAALLAEFRLSSLKAAAILPESGSESAAVVKSIVTTPLVDAICARHGVRCVGTLTGFKWIAGKAERWAARLAERAGPEAPALPLRRRAPLALRHSTLFVLGLEESHGYLADDAVRDKDANAAALLLCEFVATLRARGRTLLDALDALHLSHGAFAEDLLNVTHEGAAGAAAIRRILASWRAAPPSAVDGAKVIRITDHGAGRSAPRDEEGEPLPEEDFLVVDLADGRRVAVRASGTEPKIKFYAYARAEVRDADDLPAARARARASVTALRNWLQADAAMRAH
ncbi:MAG: phospho-sugar mutase [Opitutales bacterium]